MTDLQLLQQAALDAGSVARRYFRNKPEVWHKADQAGPVTEADLAVNQMLLERLASARPDYGWLSEESEDSASRLGTEHQFVIDPIDGTRAFIDGSRDWAHSLAVVRDGAVTAAAVYLPMRDLLFSAERGGGAFLNDAPITVSPGRRLASADILSSKSNFEGRFWRDGLQPAAKRHFRSSLAYRLCLVAEGRFDAMITFRPTWEWDIAAGALIVTEARGKVSDPNGAPLQFNNPHPQVAGVVAGGPVTDEILACVAPDPTA